MNEMFLSSLDPPRRPEPNARLLSPPVLFQPTPTPDAYSVVDDSSSFCSLSYAVHSKVPARISSTLLTLPGKDRAMNKNFPREIFERRQAAQERRRIQQHRLIDTEDEQWFHLRQSLAELKRLSANEELPVDPTTTLFNCDGYSFDALKQAIEHHHRGHSSLKSGR